MLALVSYWSCCSSAFYVSTWKGGEVTEHRQASKYNLLQIEVTETTLVLTLIHFGESFDMHLIYMRR